MDNVECSGIRGGVKRMEYTTAKSIREKKRDYEEIQVDEMMKYLVAICGSCVVDDDINLAVLVQCRFGQPFPVSQLGHVHVDIDAFQFVRGLLAHVLFHVGDHHRGPFFYEFLFGGFERNMLVGELGRDKKFDKGLKKEEPGEKDGD